MRHYGDITKLSGETVPTVDVVIGGSPCQDLSVAGKRAGLSGERSGLFAEQIRLIKEMREYDMRTGNRGAADARPRYMVWENVPGAMSSNGGEDFRAVLEQTAKIADTSAVIPRPYGKKWTPAGAVVGNGWSIGWRILDAQFWGVPQRRRRIALVADFGGQSAPEILFEREGVRGDSAEGEEQEQTSAAGTGSRAYPSVARTLTAGYDGSPCADRGTNIVYRVRGNAVDRPAIYENHGRDVRYKGPLRIAGTVTADYGMGGNNTPLVTQIFQNSGFGKYTKDGVSRTITVSGGEYGGGSENLVCAVDVRNARESDGVNGTLQSKPGGGYTLNAQNVVRVSETVRRLTPLECERLQGFPDGWTDIGAWTDTKGKTHKESGDAARYKALGNSIAIPPWTWVLKRLSAQFSETPTMASLFDGIGGFPLIWERLNGKGTCLWASEIEEFCIAVTKYRFGED